jgi:hypothetical protein
VPEERSVSAVLHDIVRDVQDIVRAEIRLAKVEAREEVKRAAWSSVWLAAGVVGMASAWLFLLWAVAYALGTTMPMWGATLIIAAVLAAAAAGLIGGGMRKVQRIQAMPQRTVDSLKENL